MAFSTRSDWQYKQVIRRLPSPDWRVSASEFWEFLDYLQAEESGYFDHKLLFLEETNRREEMESHLEIYKEIVRLLNEK